MGGVARIIVALDEQVCLRHYRCLTLRLTCRNRINRVFAPSTRRFGHPATEIGKELLKALLFSKARHSSNWREKTGQGMLDPYTRKNGVKTNFLYVARVFNDAAVCQKYPFVKSPEA